MTLYQRMSLSLSPGVSVYYFNNIVNIEFLELSSDLAIL